MTHDLNVSFMVWDAIISRLSTMLFTSATIFCAFFLAVTKTKSPFWGTFIFNYTVDIIFFLRRSTIGRDLK